METEHSPLIVIVVSSSQAIVDVNPSALHHNDTSNLVLFTELLIDENYVIWSHSM